MKEGSPSKAGVPFAGLLNCRLRDKKDGGYELTAGGEAEGAYLCRVLLKGTKSGGSAAIADEIRFRFVISPNAVHPPSCVLAGFPGSIDVGEPVSFRIEACDLCGNRVRHGGDKWKLQLARKGMETATEASEAFWDEQRAIGSWNPKQGGPLPRFVGETELYIEPTHWKCSDNGDGTYEARIVCERAGSFEVSLVRANDHGHTHYNSGAHDLAYELTVVPGPLVLANCDVGGKGMVRAVAGERTRATLGLRDRFGNPTPGPSSVEVASLIECFAMLQEDVSGQEDIVSSSMRAKAEAAYGPVSPHKISNASQALASKSPTRVPSPRSGDRLTFELEAYGGTPGCYKLWYVLRESGAWRLDISYGGQPLRTPNTNLTVEPAPPDVRQCRLVAQLDEALAPANKWPAGKAWRARLLLRDRFDNMVPVTPKSQIVGRFEPMEKATTPVATSKDKKDKKGHQASAAFNQPAKKQVVFSSDTDGAAAARAMVHIRTSTGKQAQYGEADLSATFKKAGKYTGWLWVEGEAMKPFTLEVGAALPSGRSTTMLANPEGAQIRVLVPSAFAIMPRDVCGNICAHPDGVSAVVKPHGAAIAEVKEQARSDEVGLGEQGTLQLVVNARMTGPMLIYVSACGVPLGGSPFTLYASPGDASAKQTYADLAPLEDLRQREPTCLMVYARDGLGHPCEGGGAPLHATINPGGGHYGEILGINDNNDGTYGVPLARSPPGTSCPSRLMASTLRARPIR